MKRRLVFAALWLSGAVAQQPPASTGVVLFEGARLITGDDRAPIEDSAFLVNHDKFTRIGKRGEIQLPAGAVRVDLTGKTVMPALVDAHTNPLENIDNTRRIAAVYVNGREVDRAAMRAAWIRQRFEQRSRNRVTESTLPLLHSRGSEGYRR